MGIDGFPALKIDVGILLADLDHRAFGIEGDLAEGFQVFGFEQPGQGFVRNDVDFLDFARCPEAVKKVEKGNPRPERGQLADDGQIHDFLDRTCGYHSEARVAGGHDVGVIAEDRQALAGQGPRRDIEDRRQHFAGDLVHVGEHQHQPLGCGEGRRQNPGRQTPVHGSGRPALGLHLDDGQRQAEDALPSLRGPFVRQFPHRRRRGNRVNGGNLGKGVTHVGRRGVAVDGLVLLFHVGSFLPPGGSLL